MARTSWTWTRASVATVASPSRVAAAGAARRRSMSCSQRSTRVPELSMTLTSWVSVAQSHPMNTKEVLL
ncbi:hypothetical protein [Streptomyces sp. NPDC006510]|uniref:hypothetical protein n=1 Tax=Streptomyces sp. NPDC006510 TaxID=3155600 RepID=UPI0033B94A7A